VEGATLVALRERGRCDPRRVQVIAGQVLHCSAKRAGSLSSLNAEPGTEQTCEVSVFRLCNVFVKIAAGHATVESAFVFRGADCVSRQSDEARSC
jgi:hypothetical protein